MARPAWIVVVVGGLLLPSVAEAQSDWKKTLEEGLKGKYTVTKTSGWDPNRITQAGTVFVVRQDGVQIEPSTNAPSLTGSATTDVVDGKVSQRGGTAAFFASGTLKQLKRGDRVYLWNVHADDDKLQLLLLTTDVMDYLDKAGRTRQTRCRATLSFKQPRLRETGLDDAVAMISAVILPEDEASAVQTKTVELGQTFEEVEAILGKPDTVAKLGSKTIYTYKSVGMKVIFTDGKVTDVQ